MVDQTSYVSITAKFYQWTVYGVSKVIVIPEETRRHSWRQ